MRPREASLAWVDRERPLVKSVSLRWGRILTISPYRASSSRAAHLVEDWARMPQSTCPSNAEKQRQCLQAELGVKDRVSGKGADHGSWKSFYLRMDVVSDGDGAEAARVNPGNQILKAEEKASQK